MRGEERRRERGEERRGEERSEVREKEKRGDRETRLEREITKACTRYLK